jgi:hypothetical protein
MLFVTLGKSKPTSTRRQRVARRLDWHYPEGVKVVSEYWLMTEDPTLISVVDTDDIGKIMHSLGEWDDVFEFRVFPAVTAEEGIAQARRELATARA